MHEPYWRPRRSTVVKVCCKGVAFFTQAAGGAVLCFAETTTWRRLTLGFGWASHVVFTLTHRLTEPCCFLPTASYSSGVWCVGFYLLTLRGWLGQLSVNCGLDSWNKLGISGKTPIIMLICYVVHFLQIHLKKCVL